MSRPIKGICGFTQETVVGLVANLESRELRHVEYQKRGLPPEHPRASATDDVEGIIALKHDIFDVKQFLDAQPKILSEFKKQIDLDLEFFFTGQGLMNGTETLNFLPLMNHREKGSQRPDRICLSRRGDPGVFVANRASLPHRGQFTVRAHFHRTPVELPPPQLEGQ